MKSRNGDIAVVFNGEIYNYPALRKQLESEGAEFRTGCDTEVLLHLYERHGERCVERLDGMFAFGLWDSRTRALLLARDHLGQKPVFYYEWDDGFGFASEIKALLTAGLVQPAIDLEALYHYVSLRFIPEQLSLFERVRKLPAGHYLVRDSSGVRLQRYWELSCRTKLEGTEREITEELDQRLSLTIADHLLSDVPVGAFLSGGIDSSLITVMMTRESVEPPRTFSIGVKERSFDELPFARRVARQCGTDHREEIVEADVVRLLPSMVWHLEEPADPFGVGVYLASRLASGNVKVVLSGDGGDELFAGYDRYYGNYLADIYASIPRFLRESLVGRVLRIMPDSYKYKSLTQRLRWIHTMARYAGGDRYAESMSFLRFTEEAKRQLFTEDARRQLNGLDSKEKILEHFEAANVNDLVDRMLYTDLMTRIPGHLLPIVDRMAMAHSVEVRSPFMEHRMVEFAMSIPSRLKIRRGRLKHILREVAARYLDQEIVSRQKQGFGFPLAYWMQAELRPMMLGIVRDSRLVETGIFARPYLDRLLNEHLSGARDHNYRLWLVLNLEVWYRLYIEGSSLEDVREWMIRLQTAPAR